MRFLFDENVSYRIVKKLKETFDGSVHTSDVDPPLRSDFEIFQYAKREHYVIVTFDGDFYDLQLLHGFPPKIVWLRCGNTSTLGVLNKLLSRLNEISQLTENEEVGLLEIY